MGRQPHGYNNPSGDREERKPGDTAGRASNLTQGAASGRVGRLSGRKQREPGQEGFAGEERWVWLASRGYLTLGSNLYLLYFLL